MKKIGMLMLVVMSFGMAADGADLEPSRATWWLSQNEVEPISDLINTAEMGQPVKFVDRVGKFQIEQESDRAFVIRGSFPKASIWRFDICSFDGAFDMKNTYTAYGHCAYPDPRSIGTEKAAKIVGDKEKALTHTGPWEIFNGRWLVPTARVALDGKHVYTSWFDLPSVADHAANRIYASFALDITKPGKHTIRVAFDDFVRFTRWRKGCADWQKGKPEDAVVPNLARTHHIACVAIGEDERARDLAAMDLNLKPELAGKHPRLSGKVPAGKKPEKLMTAKDIARVLIHVDFNRGEVWEYSTDAESMASANDMDCGTKGSGAARTYDNYHGKLTPEAQKEYDRLFLERFEGLYTFFVFERNYHPTGYTQNHSSSTVRALIHAGAAWDGPEGLKWLRWGAMVARNRVERLGRDGGLELMNEGRGYGLGFWETSRKLILNVTGTDLAKGPFFENEWRYVLHNSPSFPTGASRVPGARKRRNVPIPAGIAPEKTPTSRHFDDVDQVYMRENWGDRAYRARLWAGSVFGKKGAPLSKRYDWAHCRINQGSFVLARGGSEIILEAGKTRTYRKSAGNNNCILVNDTDQWGGGYVYHPKLFDGQISKIAFYADGELMTATRADLKAAYPPEAKINELSRCVIQLKPNHFLVFDRLLTDGKGKGEWRFHSAFLAPDGPSSTYIAYGFQRNMDRRAIWKRKREEKGWEPTYLDVYKKRDDVTCEVAYLAPKVRASVATSDPYFRYGKFARPTRHMKVVQEDDGPMTLLAAFAPQVALAKKGKNAFVGTVGGNACTVLVGGGKQGDLESDAHLAVAVEAGGKVEVMRFGGSVLKWKGVEVKSTALDAFGVVAGGKVAKVIGTR